MVTVGVTYGFAPHTLQDESPDVLVDHPKELAALFGGLNRRRFSAARCTTIGAVSR